MVFYDATQYVAHETIAFTAGECVGYRETFEHGADGDGAYVCQLMVAAKAFELRSGGATAAAVGAAGAVQQLRQVAAQVAPEAQVVQQSSTATVFAHETSGLNTAKIITRIIPETKLSPALTHMLNTTLLVASSAGPGGPENFEAAVKADLQAIYDTDSGRQMLESLAATGRKIYINHGPENRAGFPYNKEPAFYQANGEKGQGLSLVIEYNPFVEDTGVKAWQKRPPAIGLAHELIHAEQAAHGRMLRGIALNPGGPDPENPNKPASVDEFELEAVGIPPFDKYPISENKIRADWKPPQTKRTYY